MTHVSKYDLQITLLKLSATNGIRVTLTNKSFCLLFSLSCIFNNTPVITLILNITEYSAYTQNDSLQTM